MPQVLWRNVAAPDLSGVSQILENSRRALNDGLDAGNSLIDKYNSGQQEKNDLEVTTALAGIKDEAGFAQYLNSDAFKGKNISRELQKEVLGFRDGILGQDQSRAETQGLVASTELTKANTSDRISQTGINQAVEGRRVAEYEDKVGRRDFQRENASDEIALALSADSIKRRQNFEIANGPNPQLNSGSGRAAKTVNSGQNRNVTQDYYDSIKVSESNGKFDAKNPNSSATGLYQFIDDTWEDRMAKDPTLTADGRTDPVQQEKAVRAFTEENAATLQKANLPVNNATLYSAHFLGASGATKVLSQPDTVPISKIVSNEVIQANPFLQDMNVGDFKQWSAQKSGANTEQSQQQQVDDTARNQIQAENKPNLNIVTLPDGTQTYLSEDPEFRQSPGDVTQSISPINDGGRSEFDQQKDSIAQKYANSGLFSASEIMGKMDNFSSRADAAQAKDSAIYNSQEAERDLSYALDLKRNPDLLTEEERANFILNDGTIPTVKGVMRKLSAAKELENTAIGKLTDPSVSLPPVVNDSLEFYKQSRKNSLEANTQFARIADAEKYGTELPEVVDNLVKELGIMEDGKYKNTGEEREKIRTTIQKLSRELGVPERYIAQAMSENFTKDPSGPNLWRSRFDISKIKSEVRANFNKEALDNYIVDKIAISNQDRILQEKTVKLKRALAKEDKMRIQNIPIPSSLTQSIESIQEEIRSQATLPEMRTQATPPTNERLTDPANYSQN